MFERVSPLNRDPVTGDMPDRRSAMEMMHDPREVAAALVSLRRVFPNIQIVEGDITLASMVKGTALGKRFEAVLEALNQPE